MSAIAGIYHTNGEPIHSEHSAGIMNDLQKYPADDVQTWQKDRVFLGCHAQWITPESVGERLPFYDHESRLAITADAIIDNREELFEKLQVDYPYRKQMSDSELILRTYQKWGEASPKHLVGDFAYMIWDEREQKLFGARDFSGSRTLYYYHDGRRFIFCTVIHPILSLTYVKKELNEWWLAEFLAIPGMIDAVDVFSTVYKNIGQVPPSHSISFVDGKVVFSRYGFIDTEKKLHLKSNEEYEKAFRDVFQTAIDARLRTHRNVGSQLSGGLDSGCIAGFAAKALHKQNKKLHTYSYVPEDNFVDWTPKYRVADERPFIQKTIQHLGNVEEHCCDFKGRNPFSEVKDWLETLEMPYKFFENTFWLRGIYEKAQNDEVGILLNGARGNFSISWGPALDYYAKLLKRLNWNRLYHELLLYSRYNKVQKTRVLSVIGKKAFPRLHKFYSSEEPYQFPRLIHPRLAQKTKVFEKLQKYGVGIEGSSTSHVYEERRKHFEQIFHWNATGISGTKWSLRYGLCNRDPTNDIRVIQFCLSVPEEQFVQRGMNRALIRRATKGYLPDQVRLNQLSRGIQGADWLHRMKPYWKEFIDELAQVYSNEAAGEFLNSKVIKKAILKTQQGPKSESAFDPEIRTLMRGLITCRFLNQFL